MNLYEALKNRVKQKIPEWIRLANVEGHAQMPRMIVVDDVEEAGRLRRRYPDTLVVHSPKIYDEHSRWEVDDSFNSSNDPLEIRLSNNDKIKGILVEPESMMLAMSNLYQDWMEPPKDLNQVVDSLENSVEKATVKRQKGMDGLQKAAMNLSGKKDPQKIRSLINWILKHQFEFPEHFIREAVQNADGAYENKKENQIDVYIDTANRQVRIEDKGMAMTSKTIDDKFFNMFKSENEHLDFAAGKFGIGAVSFFGLDHESVEIDSLTEAGEGSRVVVNRKLMKGDYLPSNRTEHGTTITINLAEQSDIDFNKVKEILEQDCCYIETPLFLHMDGNSRRLNRELFPDDAMTFQENNAQGFLQKYGNGGELHLLDHRIRLKTLPIKGANGVVNCDGLSTTFSRDSIKDDAVFKNLWSFINLKRKELYQNEAVDYTGLPIDERLKRYSHFVQESLFVEDGKANEEWIRDNFSTLKEGKRFRKGLTWKTHTDFSFLNKWGALPDYVFNTLRGLVSAPYKILKAYIEEDRDIKIGGMDIDLGFLATPKPKEEDIQTIVDNELILENQLENIITLRNSERKHKIKNALDSITNPLPRWYESKATYFLNNAGWILNPIIGLGGTIAGFLSGFPKVGMGIAATTVAYSIPALASNAKNIAKGMYSVGYNIVQAVSHWLKEKVLNEEISKRYSEVAAGFKKPKESVKSYKRVKPAVVKKLNLKRASSTRSYPETMDWKHSLRSSTREDIASVINSHVDFLKPEYSKSETFTNLNGPTWEYDTGELQVSKTTPLPEEISKKVNDKSSLEQKLWEVFNHIKKFEYDAVTSEDVAKHGGILEAIIGEKKAKCDQANTLAAHYLNQLGVKNIRYAKGESHGVPHAWLEVEMKGDWYVADYTPDNINPELEEMLNSGTIIPSCDSGKNIFAGYNNDNMSLWRKIKLGAKMAYHGVKKHGVLGFGEKVFRLDKNINPRKLGYFETLATLPMRVVGFPFALYNGIKEFGVAGCGKRILKERKRIGLTSLAAVVTMMLAGSYFGGDTGNLTAMPLDVKPTKIIQTAKVTKKVKENVYNNNNSSHTIHRLLPKSRRQIASNNATFNPDVPAGYFAVSRSGFLWQRDSDKAAWSVYKKIPIPENMHISGQISKKLNLPVSKAETLEGKISALTKHFNEYEYDVVTSEDVKKYGGVLAVVEKEKKGTCAEVNTLAAVYAHKMGIRKIRYVNGFLNGVGHAWLEFERVGKWHLVDFTPKKINPELAKIMPKQPSTHIMDLDNFSYNMMLKDENAFVYIKIKEGDTRWKFATEIKKWTGVKRKNILDRIPLSKKGYLRQGIYEVGKLLSSDTNQSPPFIIENGELCKIETYPLRHRLNDKFQFCGKTWSDYCLRPLSDALEGLEVKKGKVFTDIKKGDTRFKLANKLKRVAGSNSTWQDIAERIELIRGDFATGKYEVGKYVNDRVVIGDKIKRYVEPVKVVENVKPIESERLPKKDVVKLMVVPEKLNLPVQSESELVVPYQDNTHLYLLGMGLLCGAVYLGTRKSERLDELNRDQRVTLYSLAEALPEVDVYYTPHVSSAFDLSKNRVRLNPKASIIPEIAALGYATFMRDEELAKTVIKRYGK
ncbi:MAG: transglutaminase domain-containing protein [Nanoarchaeota archaeon]|nr:transglutaminase domain-containing protein [Nanoarchaeota archaeon]